MAVAAAPLRGAGRPRGGLVGRPCRCFLYYAPRRRSDLTGCPAGFVKDLLSRHTILRTSWAGRTSKCSRGGPRRRGPRPRPAPVEVTPTRGIAEGATPPVVRVELSGGAAAPGGPAYGGADCPAHG